MRIFKNNVGRPSNEILKKRNIVRVLIAIVIIVIIMAAIIIVQNNNRVNIKYKPKYIQDDVNSELKNVYAFTYYSYGSTLEGQTFEISALSKDNKIIKLANYQSSNAIQQMAYYKGVLYFGQGSDLMSIDLTEGNGNYNVDEADLSFGEDEEGYQIIPMEYDIVDGIMYFTSLDDSYLRSYNLSTKEVSIIDGTLSDGFNTDIVFNFADKKNKKIFYQSRENSSLISYDILTKKKDVLSNEWLYFTNYFNGFASYLSSLRSFTPKIIMYDTKTNKNITFDGFLECISSEKKYICSNGSSIYSINGNKKSKIIDTNDDIAEMIGLLENEKLLINIAYNGTEIIDLSKNKISNENLELDNFIYYVY